ncbi:MAG: hypothetical protein Q9M97_02670 [Candidatus Gracilibacteria bacterium]|nr:hypothetical protein [Candidatus Gracilibacteria bacterium]
MNKKVLIGVVVFLLLLVGAGAFHMANKDKMMSWNPLHNMMMGDKMDMGGMKMGDMKMGNGDDDAMKEHCKMMPEMKGCEKYKDSGKLEKMGMDMGNIKMGEGEKKMSNEYGLNENVKMMRNIGGKCRKSTGS